jgi:hypothetical protein
VHQGFVCAQITLKNVVADERGRTLLCCDAAARERPLQYIAFEAISGVAFIDAQTLDFTATFLSPLRGHPGI